MKIANCRCAARVSGGGHSLLPAPCSLPRRRGVTLVELLITIMIIAILAGMILGVASVAGETAREAHTRHVITRLHNLLVQHLDTYKTRRVRLNSAVEQTINSGTSLNTAAKRGAASAEARLYALREMMLMEIPDRWSDVTLDAVPGAIKDPIYLDVSGTTVGNRRTELASVYLRRFNQLMAKINALSSSDRDAAIDALLDNQGAECLYMVITVACGDGEARTLFHESNIGDTDGDGAPEFLDGWGHPINFLRWAPGFDSEIQLNANVLGDPPLKANDNPTWEKAASGDHDPFDIFRVELAAYRLVPLIFSAGRDETFGIRLVKPYVTWTAAGPPPAPQAAFLPSGFWKLTPYRRVADPDDGNKLDYLGTVNDDGTATDNIHNHLLGQR